jgi:hypothetical protein
VEVEEKGRLESGTGERPGADRGESEVGAGSDDLGECHHSQRLLFLLLDLLEEIRAVYRPLSKWCLQWVTRTTRQSRTLQVLVVV